MEKWGVGQGKAGLVSRPPFPVRGPVTRGPGPRVNPGCFLPLLLRAPIGRGGVGPAPRGAARVRSVVGKACGAGWLAGPGGGCAGPPARGGDHTPLT
jgi:hypothetical protein